jgi:hypothetical protein
MLKNHIRLIIFLSLILIFKTSQAQTYPFARDFAAGTIQLPDGSSTSGLIKWFPAQEEKLIFKKDEKASRQKYRPEELAGFQVDSFRFRFLSAFEVYGNDWALLGKMTKVNHTFGQLLDSGKINSYLVFYSGYNALRGAAESYANLLFEKKTDSGYVYAAYPVAMRMKEKKFERVKENLLSFFSNYPTMAEKIKTFQQTDGVSELLPMIKNLNAQNL